MKTQNKLLVIEDDPVLTRLIGHWLESQFWHTEFVASLKTARESLTSQKYDLILLDLSLPDGDGIEFLRSITNQSQNPTTIVMTARGSVTTAVTAMQAGAYDFLVKPFTSERLIITLSNAFERQKLNHIVNHYPPSETNPNQDATPALDGCDPAIAALGMIGASLPMRELARRIRQVAPSRAAVFLHGESGSGKELAAAAIHHLSPRNGKPFIAMNCAALPKELIESEIFGHVKGAFTGAVVEREGAARLAHGGTLFFDEIAEMDLTIQAKLLRFIQTGEFKRVGASTSEQSDIRFICATHRDLRLESAAGRFREDLYYRLVVMPLTVPPLRDRGDDFILLARQFIRQYSAEEGRKFTDLNPEIIRIFRNYNWPGNIRQLQNILRQMIVMSDRDSDDPNTEITAEMLPPEFFIRTEIDSATDRNPNPDTNPDTNSVTNPSTINFSLEAAESSLIKAALAAHHGNLTHTAAALGINLSTLRRRLKQSLSP